MQFYASPRSAPCRFVQYTMAYLGIEYDLKPIYVLKGDNRTPEFNKINLIHKIPVIVDTDGMVLSESIAISIYLCQKYDKAGKLYAKDIKQVATIHQRMLFNEDLLYRSFLDFFNPLIYDGVREISQKKLDATKANLGYLEEYLKQSGDNGWVANTTHMTIADLACFTSHSVITALKVIDMDDFPTAKAWSEKIKQQIPNYAEMKKAGVDAFSAYYHTLDIKIVE